MKLSERLEEIKAAKSEEIKIRKKLVGGIIVGGTAFLITLAGYCAMERGKIRELIVLGGSAGTSASMIYCSYNLLKGYSLREKYPSIQR